VVQHIFGILLLEPHRTTKLKRY